MTKIKVNTIPKATTAENAVIGALIQFPECRQDVFSIISPSDFYTQKNQSVVKAINAIGAGELPDLFSELQKSGVINGNGDAEEMQSYLLRIIEQTATAAGVSRSAAKVREAALRREMVALSNEIQARAVDWKSDLSESLAIDATKITALIESEKAVAQGRPERKGLDVCVVDYKDLVSMDIPERETIYPWLPLGGLVMVYGPRGIGKTYFVNSLSTSTVSGIPFMKWGPPKQAHGVLVIDGEMALSDVRERLTKLLIKKPEKPLQIISSEKVFAETEQDINLVQEKQRQDILNLLDKNREIRVVVVDNISCLFSGLRESSKDDWEQVTPWLLALRRRGVSAILVHHAGKGGDQRGTSGREDLLDAVIRLDRVVGAEDNGARFIVRFTKCRGAYGETVSPFEAALNLDSPDLWTWKPIEDSTYDRMLNLAKDGITSVTEMAEELGVSKGLISRLKSRGIKNGDLKKGSKIMPVESGI